MTSTVQESSPILHQHIVSGRPARKGREREREREREEERERERGGLSPNTGSYGYVYTHELSKICQHEHGEVS